MVPKVKDEPSWAGGWAGGVGAVGDGRGGGGGAFVFSERERVSKSEIPLRDVVFVPRV